VPTETAAAVVRLEQAGYGNVGKTNLHEFAFGITSENPHFGTVPNPVAPGRVAGGSSGGNAAALALGLAELALGSDSGGSIRIPSACCGTVGFKPSYGVVPLDGCFPLAPSFDHAGPMARSVEPCTAFMELFGLPRTGVGALADLRVGVAWLERADPLVRQRVEAAAACFGRTDALDLPGGWETQPVFMREIGDVHRDLYAEHAELYGENVGTKIERCLAVTDGEQAAAFAALAVFREQMLEALEGFDVVVTPTMPMVAPPVGIGDLELRARATSCTYPLNALGAPALALPCGPAEDGLPASVQLFAAPGRDAVVLAAGALLEAALRER
jgi:aspartyl-tRNA(Asn)/glutamyl-tRNA(Gln) amidotransferase subunit A